MCRSGRPNSGLQPSRRLVPALLSLAERGGRGGGGTTLKSNNPNTEGGEKCVDTGKKKQEMKKDKWRNANGNIVKFKKRAK